MNGQILALTERVRNTISLGESHFREFKSGYEGAPNAKRPRRPVEVCRDIGETLVAFSNADGGDLLVGVEDDGTITGVPHALEDIGTMLDAPRTHVKDPDALSLNISTRLECEGVTVLFFSVGKGGTRICQLPDGRCVRRAGTSTVPASVESILFDRREQLSRTADAEFVDGLELVHLDLDLVGSLAGRYLQGLNPEKYLQQIGLAEYGQGGLRLRRAAALLFSRDVLRWHPRCQVRILKVEGTQLGSGSAYNVMSEETVQANILTLLRRSWEALRPFLSYRTEFGDDARFEQRYLYPEWACREALVNAIAHRDYTIHTGIEVFLFDDRMEIRSPGSLLSTMSVEQLMRLDGTHESRNALIARVLRETGFMQELGEGMKRIFSLMEESDLRLPELDSDEGGFRVTLFHKSVFSEQQLAWLELFSDKDLSRRQQRIVAAGMGGRALSPDDIYKAMKTDDRDTYDREVTGLRNMNVLEEIRTNAAATRVARASRKPKGSIERFRVTRPVEHQPEELSLGRTVAVFGLPETVVDSALHDVFSIFGSISEIRLPKPKPGARTRYGFVEFDDPAAAFAALTSTHRLRIGQAELSVRQANPRDA